MWTNFRFSFLRMLKQIANVPEGAVAPKWIRFCYYILFPLNWFYHKQSGIKYEPETNVYTIEGIRITGEFFRHLKESRGERFEIDEASDGTVVLRRLNAYDFFPSAKVDQN
jgi:hypothetical protein